MGSCFPQCPVYSVTGFDVDYVNEGLSGQPAFEIVGEGGVKPLDGSGVRPRHVRAEPYLGVVVEPVARGERFGITDVERGQPEVAGVQRPS